MAKSTNTDDDNEIRETARKEYAIEKADKELVSIVSDLGQMLKEKAKKADDTDTARKALQEIRLSKEVIDDAKDKARTIDEHTVEELFDELYRLIEQHEAKRDTGKDTEPAEGQEAVRETADKSNEPETAEVGD